MTGSAGVLVSLGGDIAVAGTPPRDGWPVTVAEAPDHTGPPPPQLVRLAGGAVATSSVICRRWQRGGVTLHHIVDPGTGRPAGGPWRTASVAAATCADANAAATAAIVAGRPAVSWLTREGLPARLVGHDGEVRCLGGWPSVAARLGSARKRWSRLALGELHRTLALFSVSFLGLHVATAISDPYVTIGWAATVLPFASPYRTVAIGLGALAVDIAGAVLVTSLVRQRLGYRGWRAVHWLAYLAWPVAFAHSIKAGNDLRIWWVALAEEGCALAVATAALARLLFWWRGPDPVRPEGMLG